MSHFHLYLPTIVASLLRCSCGSTSPASQPTPTSEEAAAAIASRAHTLRAQAYQFIKEHVRVTDEQVCLGLELNPSTARPRRIELVKAGLVRDSGLVATTKSGRKAVLWETAA